MTDAVARGPSNSSNKVELEPEHAQLTYLGEFRAHWPALLGTMIGQGLGSSLTHYTQNLYAPALIADFGWKKSQFALIGTLSLIMLFLVPLAGRFADRFGAIVATVVGFIGIAASLLAMSLMTGGLMEFYFLSLLRDFLGILTTALVLGKVILERFHKARGMALSISLTGPPLLAALVIPAIGAIIDSEGWRIAYRAQAMLVVAGGLLTIFLIRNGKKNGRSLVEFAPTMTTGRVAISDFIAIARQPIFLFFILAVMLCKFPDVIASSQMKLVLLDKGATSGFATLLVSAYAASVVLGRLACGLALDRVRPHIVAVFAVGVPAIGLVALASSYSANWLMAGSVMLLGASQGAEGDVGAILIARKFDLRHYSFIYSLMIASIGVATAVSSLVLSRTLDQTHGYSLFLVISAVVMVFSAISFYVTGRLKKAELSAGTPSHGPD
jgi:MFS family permease